MPQAVYTFLLLNASHHQIWGTCTGIYFHDGGTLLGPHNLLDPVTASLGRERNGQHSWIEQTTCELPTKTGVGGWEKGTVSILLANSMRLATSCACAETIIVYAHYAPSHTELLVPTTQRMYVHTYNTHSPLSLPCTQWSASP